MSGLLRPVQWLWAFSVLAQVAVFALLVVKGNSRKLPIFTTYVALNLCQAGFLYFVYSRFGYSSRLVTLAWASQAATVVAEALATTEILRLVLIPYRGIWAFGWRVLTVASMLVLVYAVVDTRGNLDWALVEVAAERGCHLVFATAVIVCLFLARYYALPVSSAYKALLGGFCFFSCTVILINTILQAVLYQRFAHYEPIWQFLTLFSYAGVQVVWAVGLRKPLPEEKRQPVLLSDSLYQRVSPEINARLGELNEKLLRLWKLEVRPQ